MKDALTLLIGLLVGGLMLGAAWGDKFLRYGLILIFAAALIYRFTGCKVLGC